ncbi:MAG: hypothetical protein JWM88_2471 [Verrucomicrobia bacterium]|nr:hypothetical protein [Verrucomicrobiota bacterium]
MLEVESWTFDVRPDRSAFACFAIFVVNLPRLTLAPSLPCAQLSPMRFAFLLVALAASTVFGRAADVEFVRVWPEWREARSFERISEYFTGRENSGREIVRRTQPAERAGFYFVARVRNSGAELPAATIVLSLIKPDAPQVRTYTFPVPLPRGEPVFNLGLTGADWSGRRLHPVAWKIEVVTADGTVLAARKSFLWEKPDK